jgi:hypothetical protein
MPEVAVAPVLPAVAVLLAAPAPAPVLPTLLVAVDPEPPAPTAPAVVLPAPVIELPVTVPPVSGPPVAEPPVTAELGLPPAAVAEFTEPAVLVGMPVDVEPWMGVGACGSLPEHAATKSQERTTMEQWVRVQSIMPVRFR